MARLLRRSFSTAEQHLSTYHARLYQGFEIDHCACSIFVLCGTTFITTACSALLGDDCESAIRSCLRGGPVLIKVFAVATSRFPVLWHCSHDGILFPIAMSEVADALFLCKTCN